MDIKYFYITVMAVFVVPASAFQGDMFITGNTELGGTVNITCSWTLSGNEAFLNVQLRSLPVVSGAPYQYYYQFNSGIPWPSLGNQTNIRMTYFNSSIQRVIVKISNLQCSDEGNYSCLYSISEPNSLNTVHERTSYLTVKARPKTPSFRLTPNTSTDILDQSNISVVCGSNVGRPGRGSLQWKIYRNDVPEVILSTDSRLDELKNVSLQAGEDSCTQRVEQTFEMSVSRNDQNLTVACFVQNMDFQNQTPDVCQSPATDLCGQTQTLRIVYGVNETDMNVGTDPPGAIYQDKTVTLTCQAAGLPAPTYTWLRVQDDNSTADDNNTLHGEMVGGRNQLVLANLVNYGGQELKYNCTASNTALGKLYSVTKEIIFQVLMTTTTVSTTTTRAAPTTTVTTSKDPNATNVASPHARDTDDPTNTIIIVVVVVGSVLIIALIIGIIFWKRRRAKKEIEEPSEKPYNNRTNLSYQSSQPDLVADKKFTSPSLDNSFSEKKEDGLMYADLTYDNRPRSRKPMAINDTSSEYSDIQMPQV